METTIELFKIIAIVSLVFSVLFVSARVYAGYIRKIDDKCSEDCSCKAINDQITDSVTVEKPKRKQVKKRVKAIEDGKLVFEKVEEKPKRGRKKQS